MRGKSELLQQPDYQIHGPPFNFSPNRNMNNTVQKAPLKDNFGGDCVDMGRYVHRLDERLSIPKFTKGAEMTDKQNFFRVGLGIKSQAETCRIMKERSGALSPR